MKAVTFLKQEVVNPNTSEQTIRLAVKFDNGKVLRMFLGDDSIDDTITLIKADRASYIAKVVVRDGEYGEYAMFSRAVTLEEI